MKNSNQNITTAIIINRLNVKMQRLFINNFSICKILFNNIVWLIKILQL